MNTKIEKIKLIEPTLGLKSQFLEMAAEFTTAGEKTIDGIGSIEIDDFDASVRRAKDHAKGRNLPEGWMPCSTYWFFRQGQILGTSNLRHELNDFLIEYGGHIGYSIRPSQRDKGYGTVMLSLTLEKAFRLGLEKVLVTCDDDNIASARVIAKNGGKLADIVKTEYAEYLVRRYWIDLRA